MSGHRWAGEVVLLSHAEMVRRIELARLEDAPPTCRKCGSVTPKRPAQKWCPVCQQMLAASYFAHDRSTTDGRYWACKACHVSRNKAYRIKVAKAGGIGISGRLVRVSGRLGKAAS